jgi:hypothetical protein
VPQKIREVTKIGRFRKKVEFDSSGLFGKQIKSIVVHANKKKPKQLAIFAEVQNKQIEYKY